jgi:hypothetical protein
MALIGPVNAPQEGFGHAEATPHTYTSIGVTLTQANCLNCHKQIADE